MKIVVVGGGSAGWMSASYLNKFVKDSHITLIESPKVGTIGVGESITVHLVDFLNKLEVDEQLMMRETGSVYKYGNNFINWYKGDESELFSFRWNITAQKTLDLLNQSLLKSNSFEALKQIHSSTLDDYVQATADKIRLTDCLLKLNKHGRVDNDFSTVFCGYDYFSKYNLSPHLGNEMLFNKKGYQHAYHINAEKFGLFLKKNYSNGVNYLQAHIASVDVDESKKRIKKLVLEDGSEIEADLFIDCSGFSKVLVKELNRKRKHYDIMPGDTAYVCQVNYKDPSKELVNHTKSIAMKQGWAFEISLYHRKGTGYIFNSNFVNEDQLFEEYKNTFLDNARMEPRRIKWEKSRLVNAAEGNVVAIGMANGFVEPMEANLFAIICNGIQRLVNTLRDNESVDNINWTTYNEAMANTYDDVADFILVHYTLSSRDDTDFWKEMRLIGEKERHFDLLTSKYLDPLNTFFGAAEGNCIFPDYMWMQLAMGWRLDISKWPEKKIDDNILDITELYLNRQKEKTIACCEQFPNNYEFLKEHIFNNVSSKDYLTENY